MASLSNKESSMTRQHRRTVGRLDWMAAWGWLTQTFVWDAKEIGTANQKGRCSKLLSMRLKWSDVRVIERLLAPMRMDCNGEAGRFEETHLMRLLQPDTWDSLKH